jgi:hypothetical protein
MDGFVVAEHIGLQTAYSQQVPLFRASDKGCNLMEALTHNGVRYRAQRLQDGTVARSSGDWTINAPSDRPVAFVCACSCEFIPSRPMALDPWRLKELGTAPL